MEKTFYVAIAIEAEVDEFGAITDEGSDKVNEIVAAIVAMDGVTEAMTVQVAAEREGSL